MLWVCLHFSNLPLDAVFEKDEQSLPCAVVDGPRNRQQIAHANSIAARHGVAVGRTLAAARASCSTLQARSRDRAGEHRLLLSLAAWAYRFSSHVSLSEPDALLVEIGASLRLFGGWPALERRLRRELAALGHTPSLAVAPIAAAARVLAGQHDGLCIDQPGPALNAVGQVPLAHSRLSAEAIALLYNVGARTLRDVFALPRPELARRIGPDALGMLDRLRGIEPEILPLYQPPDRFEHRIELEYHIESWPPLLFPLRRLCGELALFLAARDGGVQRCELALDHEDKPATRVAIELLAPQRDARALYELVRSRLERAALQAAVCGIALIAKDLPEFRPRHNDLFAPRREQGLEWPELAERLRAHLGDDAVRGLVPAADHRPENAWRFATVGEMRAGYSMQPQSFAPETLARKAAAGMAVARPPSAAARDVRQRIAQAPETGCQTTVPGAAPARHPVSPSAAARDAVTRDMPVACPSGQLRCSQRQSCRCSQRIAQAPETGCQATVPGAAPARHPVSPSAAARDALQRIAQARRLRPLWLLRRALPLRGPAPRILAGPERIESGWWDGGDTRRDYYVVETRDGQRAWAYLAADAVDGWMLHGWFA